MAREAKQAARAEAPVAEAAPPETAEAKKAAAKKPSGFPGALPVVAGGVAAALAFAGAMLVGNEAGGSDPYETFDSAGIHAARMLAVVDVDRWLPGFGTSSGIRSLVGKVTEAKKKEAAGAEDYPKFEEALARWFSGDSSPGAQWRPGFNMFFPPKDPKDDLAKSVRDASIQTAEASEPGTFIGAAILDKEGLALVRHPETFPATRPGGKRVRNVGSTEIWDVTLPKGLSPRPARWYEHPMRDREGQPGGTAVVILATDRLKTFPVMAAAGAAAALAFLGGMIGASVMASGTKNALQRLALDSDAILKGHYDTKVQIAGPTVVQHTARNLQRIASHAHMGASAPAEVVVQEVVRAPVQEIADALAPSKSFERVDELEIEATQKRSDDLGNDYYDVVHVDDRNVGVFIADIPTRGARSAMHMATVRALFRANAKGQTSPAELLKAVNRGFAADLPRGVYVTAMYAVVDRTTGLCKVASAQHLPLVFWKMAKRASARLAPEGIALGLDPGPVFDKTITEKSIQLEKGDRIVMFTDGAINAKSATGAVYGEERFYYVVNREAVKNSAACVNFVANDVDLFHEGAPLLDDFTLVTVRRLK